MAKQAKSPEHADCDTARSRTVTPSRSYRTYQPSLLPHEETLVMWWAIANRINRFDHWMVVAHRCEGAAAAAMDYASSAGRSADYFTASELAFSRARYSPVTPPPAPVSQWPREDRSGEFNVHYTPERAA